MDTDFITDRTLQKRVDESITYIFALYFDAQDNQSKEFETETCRVIILYTISIIEALLHQVYEVIPQNITKESLRDTRELGGGYQHAANKHCEVIVATRCIINKEPREIQFNELVSFLQHKALKKDTVARIKKINSLRNTFHLRKHGSSACKISDVDEALTLLELILKEIPRFLKKAK